MKIATRMKRYIDEAGIIELSRIESLGLTSKNSLRVTLSRLVAAGEVYNPVKSTYVSKNVDPFWIACLLYPGYISLSSAFYLHHLTDEYPFTIFVASNVRRSVNMGNQTFVYFKAKDYLGIEKGKYNVASIEKAICDSLRFPDKTDYAKLEKVLFYADLKANMLIGLSRDENAAFFQRLGYLLYLLPKTSKEKRVLLAFCKRKVKANTYLQGRRKGVYIKEWRLIDNIGEKVLLSWWQQ